MYGCHALWYGLERPDKHESQSPQCLQAWSRLLCKGCGCWHAISKRALSKPPAQQQVTAQLQRKSGNLRAAPYFRRCAIWHGLLA